MEPVPVRLQRFQALTGDELAAAGFPGEQHAAFLEGLANRCHLHRLHVGICRGAVEQAIQIRVEICVIRLATGEHEGAGGKVDLVVADHHENLQTVGAVPQHQDGRGRNGLGGFLVRHLARCLNGPPRR